MSTQPSVGKPISSLEGKLKVTGADKYSAEYTAEDLLYGYAINSTITKGKIKSVDTTAPKALDGVVEIFTHENRPKLALFDIEYADIDAPPGTVFKPLKDAEIMYNGQLIALVVAKDFETARFASTLVKFEYEEAPFETCLDNIWIKPVMQKKGWLLH